MPRHQLLALFALLTLALCAVQDFEEAPGLEVTDKTKQVVIHA